jgi:murein L,D-transpeptidase YafK
MRFCYLIVFIIFISCNGNESKNNDSTSNNTAKFCTNYNLSLTKLVDLFKIKKTDAWLEIKKSKYLLSVIYKSKVVKSYPIVLGYNPKADKLKEGDYCTPEGKFIIKNMNPHEKWSKFLLLNYPNESSYKKHKLAKLKGLIPKDSEIGGEVGIHGVPNGKDFYIDIKKNWTWGCISLKNKDINEIYDFAFVGMPVLIKK